MCSSDLFPSHDMYDVIIRNGNVELGFMADGAALAWCRIDDVKLVKTGDLDEPNTVDNIQKSVEVAQKTEYYSLNGKKITDPKRGLTIVRKTFSDHTETSKILIKRN